jgi:hypothetical protein
MEKRIYSFASWPLALRQLLTMLLQLGVCKNYKKNEFYASFKNKSTTSLYGIGIEQVWCQWKANERFNSFIQKKFKIKIVLLPTWCPNIK